MNQTVLYSAHIEDLLEQFRAIVREEMKQEKKQENDEKLLSPAEACKLFVPAISRTTIDKWVADGRLKRYDLGGRVWFKQSEIFESAKSLKKYKSN
jgi:excisionase family DNA binding protein